MIHIFLIAFILAFSLIFCGCPVCQIKNTVLKDQLNELCAAVEWSFKSYEERIEYSLSPFLDNIDEDFKEYQELREKTFTFVEELKLPRDEEIGEKEIEEFLEKFFDPNKIGKEEGVYIFAKEQVKEILNELNSYYLKKVIDFQIGRKELQEDITTEEFINHIVFSIYIAKDTIEKENEKSKEFISELSKLYESEHGKVGGFVKLQQRRGEKNYNNSFYNIDELYEIFTSFYDKDYYKAKIKLALPGGCNESNVCDDMEGSIAEDFAGAVVNFYKKKGKAVDKNKQIERFKKEIRSIVLDIPRTGFNHFFKERIKEDEYIKILSGMVFFAVFCCCVINEKEDSYSLSANDIIKELSGMQGLGEEQIRDIRKNRQYQSSREYAQGLNFFAGFFVILYFLVNQKFGGNVNKEGIIDGKEEIMDESKIIKLFVFYFLHKWDCDSSVNYLPSCSLYDVHDSTDLFLLILLRRCKLLHVCNNYVFNKELLSIVFINPFFSYKLSRITNINYCINYIMYLDLHLYIVKKKDINFYFDWFNFLYYRILHIIEKRDLKYYGYGPYAGIVKVLFPLNKDFTSGAIIEKFFFHRRF